MRNLKSESGQVLVLTALSMSLLLGFAGFATDVGMLFHAKRGLQAIVDDAAVAGAQAYKFANEAGNSSSSTTTDIQNAAKAALSLNGLSSVTIATTYSSNVTSPTLFISSPPADGPNQGTAGFVEAILTVPESTTFMRVFGFNTMNVMTRAVAGPGGPSIGCLYVLDPTGQSMYMGGKFVVNAPGCGIPINSSDNCALSFNGGGQGSSSTLTAGWVEVNGGACGQTSDSNPPPTINTGLMVPDPIVGDHFPVPATDCSSSGGANGVIDNNTTISASYTPANGATVVCFPYTVTIKGTGTAGSCTSSTYLYLHTAIYVFEKGVIFSGGCIATDATGGATIDLRGSYLQGGNYYSLTVNTQTQFLMGAPQTDTPGCGSCSDGDYGNSGILIEEDPVVTPQGIIAINTGNSSGATGSLKGILYAPSAELLFTDQGATSGSTNALDLTLNLVVGSFYDQASSLTLIPDAATSETRLTATTLVE